MASLLAGVVLNVYFIQKHSIATDDAYSPDNLSSVTHMWLSWEWANFYTKIQK
jgi:hypothetical protein